MGHPLRPKLLLENLRQPGQTHVERVGIEQEVRHDQERYEDEQSLDAVPDGWPHFFRHGAEYRRIGLARKDTLLTKIAGAVRGRATVGRACPLIRILASIGLDLQPLAKRKADEGSRAAEYRNTDYPMWDEHFATRPAASRRAASSRTTLAIVGRSGRLRRRATDSLKPPHAAAAPPATEPISSKLSPTSEPNQLIGRISEGVVHRLLIGPRVGL